MCLCIDKETTSQIAKEDISVFKIARYRNDKIFSYYQDFKYDIGREYETELGKPMGSYWSIYEGFHSYLGNYKFTRFCEGNILYINTYFEEKSVDTYRIVLDHETCVILDCIIPKGSKYYVSCDGGTIVSDKIKVIDFKRIE